jgi:rfaE bifunctional protein nucleotidyltransferase chain/domain
VDDEEGIVSGRGRPSPARHKLLTQAQAARAVRAAQRRGECVVFTSGCFDLLHVGHLRSLEQARGLGERLVVGVNSDASVRRIKGSERPVVPARQRAELLAGLACVDWVVVFGGRTPRAVLAALRPDVYAKGGDWPLSLLRSQDVPPDFAGAIRRLRQIPGVRSSAMIERVMRGRSGVSNQT